MECVILVSMLVRLLFGFALLITLPGSPVFADDDCAEVRLDVPGGTMEGVRVQNQESLGTCQAEAVAQYLSALSRKQGHVVDIDPIALALNATAVKGSKSSTELDGISLSDLVSVASSQGVCTQEDVSATLKKIGIDRKQLHDVGIEVSFNRRMGYEVYRRRVEEYQSPGWNPNIDYRIDAEGKIHPLSLQDLDDISKEFNRRVDQVDMGNNQKLWRMKKIGWSAEAADTVACRNSLMYTDPSLASAKTIVPLMAPLATHLQSILPVLCNDRSRVKFGLKGEWAKTYNKEGIWAKASGRPSTRERIRKVLGSEKNYNATDVQGLKKQMDSNLKSKSSLPVLISYCAGIFKRDEGTERTFMRVDHQDCGMHAGLVIGRRKNPITGKCQLLIRNSWGNSNRLETSGTKSECYAKAKDSSPEEVLSQEEWGVLKIEKKFVSKLNGFSKKVFHKELLPDPTAGHHDPTEEFRAYPGRSSTSKGGFFCSGNHWVDQDPFIKNSLQSIDSIH